MSNGTEDSGNSNPTPRRGRRRAVPDELEQTTRAGDGNGGPTGSGAPPHTVVTLSRTAPEPSDDQGLWVAIRNRTRAIGFDRYATFINQVLCLGETESRAYEQGEAGFGEPDLGRRRDDLIGRNTLHGVDSYKLLKLATDAFLILQCGLVDEKGNILDPELLKLDEERRRLGQPGISLKGINDKLQDYFGDLSTNARMLPYLERIVKQIVGQDEDRRAEMLPYCENILSHRLTCPSLIELIWSYWHEEGMLVQTTNAISLRFQNKRSHSADPLANLELDPLRPMNHLFWGFIQDEYSRLSVQRRAYEYDHHYGFSLVGKAVPRLASADSRSKFLEAFHNLLHRTALFYREDDDTTIVADAFSLVNALREVHLILAEGAHNQYGELPWTARREMLIMQWLLARPETKEFLRGRYMVPYQEPWMGAVDDMKRLQGWSDTTVTHFHELGVHGEQILLSIRFGDWIEVNDQELARNWARYWRPEIQRYIHAYNAVTGVDLSSDVTDVRFAENRYVQPAVLLSNRPMSQGSSRRALPPARRGKALPAPTTDREWGLDLDPHRQPSRRGR